MGKITEQMTFPPFLDWKEVESRVQMAIDELKERDSELLERDVNERSISHRLACYLQCHFPEWDVDCEYNRKGSSVKQLELSVEKVRTDNLEARTVYPDIIVHKRGIKHNLLVIEMKKGLDSQREDFDRQKLYAFQKKADYRYRYALFLRFNDREPVLQWIGEDAVTCHE